MLAPLALMCGTSGCYSFCYEGFSPRPSVQTVTLDVLTSPIQIPFFAGFAILWGVDVTCREGGRYLVDKTTDAYQWAFGQAGQP